MLYGSMNSKLLNNKSDSKNVDSNMLLLKRIYGRQGNK